MNLIPQLWQPILLASVLVFIASSIIWMALPIHKHDYKDPGDKEGPLMDLLRKQQFKPGLYYVPWCHGGKGNDPAMAEKLKNGPWAILSVSGSAPNMGKMLGAWFAHLLIISFYVAYVLNAAVPAGAPYLHVFRVAGSASLLAYAGYAIPMSIWHGQPWKQVPGRLFDGVVYALLTAGSFAWLWPAAHPA